MLSSNIFLKNTIPIDLNFLLYLKNIYLNHYDKTIRFPGKIGFEDGLLSLNQFNQVFIISWNRLLEKHEKEIAPPVPALLSVRDEFLGLFKDNSAGEKNFEVIWEHFQLWWCSSYGIASFMERTSDSLIVPIAEKLTQLSTQFNVDIPKIQLQLIVVFDKLPDPLKNQNSNFLYVVHLEELYKPDVVESISKSFFNLITNNSF